MRRHPPSYVPATLTGQITHPLASEVLRSSEASFGIPLMLVHSFAAIHALCRYMPFPGAQPTRVVSTMTFLKHKVTCRHTRSIAGHFYETLLRRGLAGARRGSPAGHFRSFHADSRAGHLLVYIQWLWRWKGFRRLDRVVRGGVHPQCGSTLSVDWESSTGTCPRGLVDRAPLNNDTVI